MSNQPITKSALARQLKTSPAMITKYARMGMPVRDDGLVDSKAAETWIATNVHLRVGNEDKGANRARRLIKSARKAGPADLTDGRARLVQLQADQAQFKLERERGLYVLAADVERTWSHDWRSVQQHMLAVPSKIQQRLTGLTRHDIEEIDRTIRDALTEAADGIIQDAEKGKATEAGNTTK